MGLFAKLFTMTVCISLWPAEGTSSQSHALFAQWKHSLEDKASFSDISSFLIQHPGWPRAKDLKIKAENEFTGQEKTDDIVAYFDIYFPETADGCITYATALLTLGKKPKATEVFRKLISSYDMNDATLAKLVSLRKYLPKNWVFKRAQHLLYREKCEQVGILLSHVSERERDILKARIRLIKKDPNAEEGARTLLSHVGNDMGLHFELIRYYRKTKNFQKAVDLFFNQTFDDENDQPLAFWVERNYLAREMIEVNRPLDALKLIRNHRLSTHKNSKRVERVSEDYVNAQWMAGWLSLRYGNNGKDAQAYFESLIPLVKTPISIARVFYWLGETARYLSQHDKAIINYKKAADQSTTFYGQMAISVLRAQSIAYAPALFQNVNICNDDIRKFSQDERIRVLEEVPESLAPQYREPFFTSILETTLNPVEQKFVFDLVKGKGFSAFAVLLSKRMLVHFKEAYPLLSKDLLNKTVNKLLPKSRFRWHLPTLTHAIIRRESSFDPSAKSSAGATGLMQLMPATAEKEVKNVKKLYGLSFSPHMPLTDQTKNVTIGAAHIESLLEKHQGNLILSIAEYNAGPAPVARWVSLFGDPRAAGVDLVHWIECIPYAETRNYVQRVLENFMVYYMLLQEAGTIAKTIEFDLLQFLKVRFV
jgi:soluble lytic murein transglycosylase